MWVQLQIPKIEDGNNFGVAVQVGHGKHLRWTVSPGRVSPVVSPPTGESVWAADQHPHQDRGLPDPDFKVRAQTGVPCPSIVCVTRMRLGLLGITTREGTLWPKPPNRTTWSVAHVSSSASCVSVHVKTCVSALQGDYRQLVHELDQYQYSELRLVVLDIRNTYVRDAAAVQLFTWERINVWWSCLLWV